MRALVDRTHRNVDNGRQGNVMTTWGRTRRIGALSSGRLFLRSAILCLSLLALAGGLTGVSMGQGDHALLVEIDAAINSVTAGYLDRAMEKAAEDEAELIIVQLDTPGGLLDSTRDMVSDLLESRTPSVVYVAPGGARAASAGTFIAAAAHFAVMAPGDQHRRSQPRELRWRGAAGYHQEQSHGGRRGSYEGHSHRAGEERGEAGGDGAQCRGLHL